MHTSDKPGLSIKGRQSGFFSSSLAAIISVLLLSGPTSPSPPPLEVDIVLTDAFPAITFSSPLLMKQPPGDDTRFMVVEQSGRIQLVLNGNLQGTPFLEITDRASPASGEQGLLGFAYDPEYPTDPYIYVSYSTRNDTNYPRLNFNLAQGDSVVSRFELLDNSGTPDLNNVDTSSELVILTQSQFASNHNGGNIEFGPDGYLYIGLGDGGGGGDPQNHGQDTSTWLGALLRIDVSSLPYTIPGTNPYSGQVCDQGSRTGNCPEIYAYGLRNPWRFTFDDFANNTDELWLGDVGQNIWEEVDRVELGGNYGWDCREGPSAYTGPPGSSSPQCGSGAYIGPVTFYVQGSGDCSVTGGYVYRGSAVPGLVGSYIYGDYCSGKIRGLPFYSIPGSPAVTLLDTNHSISSFARDNQGEIYLTDLSGGKIYRIVPSIP